MSGGQRRCRGERGAGVEVEASGGRRRGRGERGQAWRSRRAGQAWRSRRAGQAWRSRLRVSGASLEGAVGGATGRRPGEVGLLGNQQRRRAAVAARVEPRFIAPAAHVSDSFTALHVSSEGLNPSLPQGSETRLRGKANSGGVALGGHWAPLTAADRPARQADGSAATLSHTSGHVSHWPGAALTCLPLWRPLSERPLPPGGPRAQLQTRHASLCWFSISTRLDPRHLRPSAHYSIASNGPLSTQPLDTEPRVPQFLLLPPSRGQSVPYPQRILAPWPSLHAHHL